MQHGPGAIKGHEGKAARDYRVLAVVAVLILTVPLWQDPVSSMIHLNIANLMVRAGIFACAAIGLNLLVGYAGQVSLGHAAFFGFGAYTTAILTCRLSWFPPALGILCGAAVASVIALLVGGPILRLKGHYLAMATLGLGEIAVILFTELRGLTGGTEGVPAGLHNGLTDIPPIALPGITFDTDFKLFFLVWIIVFLLILASINIVNSRVGRGLRALDSSEVAADAMGVNTARFKIQVFVISAGMAGLGGALFSHFLRYINPESFTFSVSVLLFTMVVIGGMGNIWGGVIGSITLTFLPQAINELPRWLPSLPASLKNFTSYELILYGALLVLFIIFLPKGLASGFTIAIDRFTRWTMRTRDRLKARKYEGRR